MIITMHGNECDHFIETFFGRVKFCRKPLSENCQMEMDRKAPPTLRIPFQMTLCEVVNFFDDWKVEGIMKQDSSLRNITFVKKKKKMKLNLKL